MAEATVAEIEDFWLECARHAAATFPEQPHLNAVTITVLSARMAKECDYIMDDNKLYEIFSKYYKADFNPEQKAEVEAIKEKIKEADDERQSAFH